MAELAALAADSGMQATQTWLDETGNNIANSNTPGYKAGQVQFTDLLTEQISGAAAPPSGGASGGVNPVAVGSGVRVAAVATDLTEGSLAQTGINTDVAIQGTGYLVIQQNGAQGFTRDGALTVDANGNLTTQSGGLVQGWPANSSGVVDTTKPIGAITIPQGETIGANETQNLDLSGNLPAWNGVGTAPVETKTINAYDALGNTVPVTLTFTGVTGTANQWTVQGSVPNPGGGPATALWTTAPTVKFDPTSGQITSVTGATTNPDGSLSLPVTTMPAGYNFKASDTWNFVFPAPGSATAVTQFNASSSIQVSKQDGFPSGSLNSYSIAPDGTITGSFSNGQTLNLGQIALASFANPGGLADTGNGLFTTSANSGQAQVGVPGSGGLGTLLGGELEQSNVNLGTELTNLITAQQAYVGDTKTLQTDQQMVMSLEQVA